MIHITAVVRIVQSNPTGSTVITVELQFLFDILVRQTGTLEKAPRHKMAALLSRLVRFLFDCMRENHVLSDGSSLINSTTI